jgi:hypothetical protein
MEKLQDTFIREISQERTCYYYYYSQLKQFEAFLVIFNIYKAN